jgi:cysteinyl-tRNA synthetase
MIIHNKWPAYKNLGNRTHPLMKVIQEKHEQVIRLTEENQTLKQAEWFSARPSHNVQEIQILVNSLEERRVARLNKDYETSDRIRHELEERFGVQIKDMKG